MNTRTPADLIRHLAQDLKKGVLRGVVSLPCSPKKGETIMNSTTEAIAGGTQSFDIVVTWLKGRHPKRAKPVVSIQAVEAAMAIAGRNVDALRRSRSQLDVA